MEYASRQFQPVPTHSYPRKGDLSMKAWTRPDFQEVSLGCEINCYAPAEV